MLNYSYGEHTNRVPYNTIDNQLAGQLPFQLSSIGDFYCDDDYFTERSGDSSFLLLYTLQGAGDVRYRDQAGQVAVGQLALFNCRHYQYYAPAAGTRWRFRWLHFHGDSADTFAGLVNKEGLQIVDADADGVIDGAFHRIFTVVGRQQPGREHMLSLDVHAILCAMAEQAASQDKTLADSHTAHEMQRMEDYIRASYDKPLTVEGLAKECHLSKYYFIRAFSACTGSTPYEYLIKLRIRESKRLLAQTTLPVSEVAARVGFADAKGFIGHFQKREGISPGRFRREFVFHALG